jgi:hypothetical protein
MPPGGGQLAYGRAVNSSLKHTGQVNISRFYTSPRDAGANIREFPRISTAGKRHCAEVCLLTLLSRVPLWCSGC